MSYRSDSQAIQQTADALAEKIQILGAQLLHPEERILLKTQALLLEGLCLYLRDEDRAELAAVLEMEIPTPDGPRTSTGKESLIEKHRTIQRKLWRRRGRPELLVTHQDGTTWTLASTEYLGLRNWVYLIGGDKTLLVHKTIFRVQWGTPRSTGQLIKYPPFLNPPDEKVGPAEPLP